MLPRLAKIIASFRNGILLLTVYALHLLFYQALMAMPAENFSTHFSLHHSKNNPGKSHPAKYEYRILLKHEDEKSPVPFTEPQTFDGVAVKIISFPISNYAFNLTHLSSFNLPDDAYKLYRLLGVFLI